MGTISTVKRNLNDTGTYSPVALGTRTTHLIKLHDDTTDAQTTTDIPDTYEEDCLGNTSVADYDNLFLVAVPEGTRFLQTFHHTSNGATVTTDPVIRVFGKTKELGPDTGQGAADAIEGFWVPLRTRDDISPTYEATLDEERQNNLYGGTMWEVTGAKAIVVSVSTAAVFSAGSGDVVGRFISH